MDYKRITLMVMLVLLASANRCINSHCLDQQKTCKADTSKLPCHNIINTCLDHCSTNQSYACLSLCLSLYKNDPANKFLSCCSQFSCKVERIVNAGEMINLMMD